MNSMLPRKDWSAAPPRQALSPTQIVSALATLDGWALTGSGEQRAIEKTYRFGNYFETIAFVNAVAFIAHMTDHHPDLIVHYNRCIVKFSTHDVKGISLTDLDCAKRIDDMLPERG